MTVSPLSSPGPNGSYDDFYQQYFPRVRMLVARHFVTCDADEIAQETMARCYVKYEDFDPRRDPWPLVSSVARNAAIDSLRRAARLVSVDELPEPPGGTVDTTYEAVLVSEKSRIVRLALSRLRPADRQLIEDRELEGLPFATMAAARDISENTLRQQLRRARLRLLVELRRVGANLGVVPVAVQLRLTRFTRRFNDVSAGAGPAGASALSMAAVAGVATVATLVGNPFASPAEAPPQAAAVVSTTTAAPAGTTRTRVAPADTRVPRRAAAKPRPAPAPAPPRSEERPVVVETTGDLTDPGGSKSGRAMVRHGDGEYGTRWWSEAPPGYGVLCYLDLAKCPPER